MNYVTDEMLSRAVHQQAAVFSNKIDESRVGPLEMKYAKQCIVHRLRIHIDSQQTQAKNLAAGLEKVEAWPPITVNW